MISHESEDLDVELLYDLSANPLNLNKATGSDLALIPSLTPHAIAAILARRRDEGDFSDFQDLARIDALSDMDLSWMHLLTFIPAADDATSQRSDWSVLIRSRMTRRLDIGRGYFHGENGRAYAGSPERHYQRLRVTRGSIQGNITLDKHPGERYAWDLTDRRFGFDFASYYLRWESEQPVLRRLVIGDYTLGFGQGLALGSNLFGGKSRESVRGLSRSSRGVREAGSSLRESHQRGVALTLELPLNLNVHAFASRRWRSATIDSLLIDGTPLPSARSVPSPDIHRTASEELRRRSLRESLVGSAVEYRGRNVTTGVTLHHVTFDPPLKPPDRIDLAFVPERSRHNVVSGYASIGRRNASVFGEVAAMDSSTLASIVGINLQQDDVIEAVVIHRIYPASFDNHLGSAFGHQRGRNRNEHGLYVGLRARLSPSLLIRAYVDDVRFPWMRFGHRMPSSLSEWLVDAEHRPRRWMSTNLMIRQRTETYDDAQRAGESTGTTIRLHTDLSPIDEWRFQVRVETRHLTGAGMDRECGTVFYQDVAWRVTRRISVSARHMLFQTDPGARMYAYERDLAGAFGMVSVAGRGNRTYLTSTWKPTPAATVQLKYGETRYLDITSIGSGHDQVEGNRLREVRAQLQLVF